MNKQIKPLKIKPSQRKQTYKAFDKKKRRNRKTIVKKRFYVLVAIVIIAMTVLLSDLFYVQVIENDHYIKKVEKINTKIVEGPSAPRGRIYDRNHNLLVDNVPIKTIYYKKQSGTTSKEEIALAYTLADMLEIDFSSLKENDLKQFWIISNPEKAKEKITEEEWQMLEERKITKEQITKLQLERVNKELEQYTKKDKKAAYFYTLMNKGYSYSEKVLKNENVTDEEYARISEKIEELKGVDTRLDWDRTYPYGTTFKAILGTISTSDKGIPLELKNDYLAKGYSLNDRVGTSYLEYQYEEYLKGKKDQYQVLSNGEYELIKEGERGNDLVLTIDIKLQQEIEKILEKYLLIAKKEPNTSFYNRSFVIIQDPNTGEILAMTGKQIIMNKDGSYEFRDYTPGVVTSPIVVGSVIKGASHIVGYNTGALKIGEVRNDACIKIASTNLKCSWKEYGNINDLYALKYSSNTYQFRTAMKVAHANYVYNGPLFVPESAFETYRKTFEQFGLGVKTEIDLPVESTGYKGTSTVAGHLLDLAIGQYDNYTPIQLSQYISTIANGGKRLQPHLLKEVYAPTKEPFTKKVYTKEVVLQNELETKPEYLARVRQAFKMVLERNGTGYYSMDLNVKPAGKTGTSQSFIDSDGNGIVDTETITTTFAGYAPYDNPVMSMVVVSPDSFYNSTSLDYEYPVNRKISYEVSKKFFEIYK